MFKPILLEPYGCSPMEVIAADIPYNRESERLQKLAGVEPDECLKIAVVPGEARTLMPILFAGLKHRLWISPSSGTWRSHDESLHWAGVRRLNPESVKVVMWAAAIGEQRLMQDRAADAVPLSSALDFFIDVGSTESWFNKLIERCGSDVGAIPTYTAQAQHTNLMKQLEDASAARTSYAA